MKNDYAIDLGLKQQWTRLDPKEGKQMEFGNSIHQTPSKVAPDPPSKVRFYFTGKWSFFC